MYVCPAQDPSGHQTVLGTTFFTLAVFVVLYVLVYVECLVRRWLRASALLIWVCLMMLGYVLVFDSWRKTTHVGAQVTGQGTLVSLGAGCHQASVHPATPALPGYQVPPGDGACIRHAGLEPSSSHGPWVCDIGWAPS